jgi:hypothetical protein
MFCIQGIALAQSSQSKFAQEVILTYLSGGHHRDLPKLESVLHDDFRIIWHDQQKTEHAVVPRSVYLMKIASEEWGGEERTMKDLKVISFDDTNLVAKVSLVGVSATMHSMISMVNHGGEWKMVSELVTASFN